MIIRVMGEMDIHSFTAASLADVPPHIQDISADGLDSADYANWLGSQLDGVEAEQTLADDDKRSFVEQMASYLLSVSETEIGNDEFVMMLVLREKWPVGSKAKFKIKADRVGASHTYHLIFSPTQTGVDFGDDASLQQAETKALTSLLPVLKKNRKAFANSSGLQQFLKQVAS